MLEPNKVGAGTYGHPVQTFVIWSEKQFGNFEALDKMRLESKKNNLRRNNKIRLILRLLRLTANQLKYTRG